MIKEQAIVIALDTSSNSSGEMGPGRALVRVDRKSSCQACQMKAACGQKLVNESSQKRCIEFEVDNSVAALEGDLVTIAVPERSFLQASLIMYLMPLVLMIVFAVIAEHFYSSSDLIIFLLSAGGFMLGLYGARKFAQHHKNDPDYHPIITELTKRTHLD